MLQIIFFEAETKTQLQVTLNRWFTDNPKATVSNLIVNQIKDGGAWAYFTYEQPIGPQNPMLA